MVLNMFIAQICLQISSDGKVGFAAVFNAWVNVFLVHTLKSNINSYVRLQQVFAETTHNLVSYFYLLIIKIPFFKLLAYKTVAGY